MKTPEEESYALGIQAGHEWWTTGWKASLEPPANPYPPGSPCALEWYRGFQDGADDGAAADGW